MANNNDNITFSKKNKITSSTISRCDHKYCRRQRTASRAVAKLVEDHAIEGQTLTFPISYKVGEYLLSKSIQNDLIDYLSKAELVKVIKFYQTMWELDVSINGIASTLGTRERDGKALTSEQVNHVKMRKERIDSFCEVICAKEIRKLKDLPDDYRSVKGPESVVSKT